MGERITLAGSPFPRSIRLAGAGPRCLRLLFETPETARFLQARHALWRYGYVIEQLKTAEAHGPHDRSSAHGNPARPNPLLSEDSALVFLERTHVHIEGGADDDPAAGFPVDDWYESIRGAAWAERPAHLGSDRAATMRSDILLHVPGRSRPQKFSGETRGQIVVTSPEFQPSGLHPWLRPDSFDAWFVPEGSEQRLAAMSADESLRIHPFSRALASLADRLADYSAILNLPTSAYYLRDTPPLRRQLPLFREPIRLWVVIGERAAGKTTFGEYAETCGVEHYEASTVIRLYYAESDPPSIDFRSFVRALHVLRGDDLVIRTLTEDYGLADARTAVVTGLRRFADLLFLSRNGIEYLLVYIAGSAETRYARYLRRARDASPMSLEAFTAEGDQHAALYQFAQEFADVTINNEYDFDAYLKQIDFVLRCRQDRPSPDGVVLSPESRSSSREAALERAILFTQGLTR